MTPIIIDFETLSQNPSNGIAISFSAVPLDVSLNFKQLQEKAFFTKLNIDDQQDNYKRKTMKSTMEWWSSLSPEVLKKSFPKKNEGLTVAEFVFKFEEYIKTIESDPWKVLLVCRGSSFDIQYLNQMYRDLYNRDDVSDIVPWKFWNEMNVRSFVKGTMLTFDNIKLPIDENLLIGFEKHNPLHDIAKDVILIQQALEYASGKELPTNNIIMV